MFHLLPQFKCLPGTFSSHSKSHFHSPTLLSTNRWHIYFRMPSILPRTSPQTSTATTVLDTEKLQLTSLEAHSNLAAADLPCTCVGAIGSPTETTFGAVLAKEISLAGEEAITHATVAEAVSLAKSAANVSGDSRMMFGHCSSSKLDGRPAIIPSEPDKTQLAEIGLVDLEVGSTLAKNGLGENCYPSKEADDLEQILNDVAVRSRCQTKRKSRREKVLEKAAAKDTCAKSGCSRRASVPQGEYFNILGVLDGVASKSRFLTRAEEHKLSQGVQDLLKIQKIGEELDHGATFAEWAAAAGVDEKTLKYRLGYGIRCKDKIIRSNIRLVVAMAQIYQGPGRDLGELVRVGCQGLVKTAERFDPRKGRFGAYAPWWIRRAIQRCIQDQSSSVRIPVHLAGSLREVKVARDRLYSENGRPPSKAQLAKETRLSEKSLELLLLLPEPPRSLDQNWLNTYYVKPSPSYTNFKEEEEDEEDPFEDCSPEEAVRRLELKRELEMGLDILTPRDKQIVKWRFGMDCERPMTLQAIADLLDLSKERVRQIVDSAIRELRVTSSNRGWRLYLRL